MARSHRWLAAALAPAALLSACTRTPAVAKPAPSGPAAAAAPAGGPRPMAAAGQPGGGPAAAARPKTIAEATAGSRRVDGLFPLYRDTATGALHMVVSESQLGKEFIYFSHTVDAPVSSGHFRGMYRGSQVFAVRRHFNKLEFVQENTAFHFDPANSLSRAARANISPSVLAVQEIVARDEAKGEYLVKADDMFLTETLIQVKPSPQPGPPSPPQPVFALGQLSRGKTRVSAVHNYPKNTDVEVDYVYENLAPVAGGDPGVEDPRNVTVRVRHTLLEMPEAGFEARYDDPRVGFFTTQITDLTSTSATPYRDPISRWRLVKKDPAAAVSEPVDPIVFWIENTTPRELRQTIRDATLAWNPAFEAAGFRNAVVVKEQPDDADWDAGDIRYNVIRWTSSPVPPFGGYGPRFGNPRTGETIGADIMLEYAFVTNRLRHDRVFSEALLPPLSAEDPAAHADPDHCSIGENLHASALFAAHALRAFGADEVEVSEKLREALHYLVLHEVGHTLGLTHNMRATQMLSRDQLRDAGHTASVGLYGSVMDYPAVNVTRGAPRPQVYTTRPGPYDVWAITYGYSEEMRDAGRRQAHLARSSEPALAYGNDADDMRAPGKAIDPRVMLYDLSSDAIGYAEERIEMVDEVVKSLVRRFSTPGGSFHELRNAYLTASAEQANGAAVVSRYIGGVYVERAMAGQPGATQPFRAVPGAEQRRAMRVLREHVFAPTAFAAPAELYAHLQMQRRGFDHGAGTEDPKIHDRVLNVQRAVLEHVMHPVVLRRVSDSRLYGNDYPVVSVLDDLTDAVFADDARGSVNTFRQNLQAEYVRRLVRAATEPAANYDALSRAAALRSLR
ncbi:MAG TPA: zinc-dependent metalloprotease, partial [Longimicrobium sp.]|nr:zinc-dependent metalloprotease [Longimicrobium sp.]